MEVSGQLYAVALSVGKNPGTHRLGGRVGIRAHVSCAARLGPSGCSVQYLLFFFLAHVRMLKDIECTL